MQIIPFESFFKSLCIFFDKKNIAYVIARNYESILDGDPGRDMDILIQENDIKTVLAFLSDTGIILTGVVIREYVTSVFCMGIKWKNHLSLSIDLVHKLNYQACPYLDLCGVLDRRRLLSKSGDYFFIPELGDELLILMMEGLFSGKQIKGKYWQKIIASQDRLKTAIKRLEPALGPERVNRLFEQISGKRLPDILTDRRRLVFALFRKAFFKRPAYTAKQYFIHVSRELSIRLFYRPVLNAAFLGPDGSGKSTLISHIVEKLNGAAGKIIIRHLKPVFLFKKRIASRGIVTEPHALALRSWLTSNLKILMWWLELWLDRLVCFPRTLTIDIFDRCMWDILIDPKRYRFNGSIPLLKILLKSSPATDIVIVVVAPPVVIQTRKAEVPINETERQVKQYTDLAKENGFILLMNDTNLDDIAELAIHGIVMMMSDHYGSLKRSGFYDE